MEYCDKLGRCNYCANHHPEMMIEEQCDKFGVPIGDGSAHCGGFQCNKDNCNRTNCINF